MKRLEIWLIKLILGGIYKCPIHSSFILLMYVVSDKAAAFLEREEKEFEEENKFSEVIFLFSYFVIQKAYR